MRLPLLRRNPVDDQDAVEMIELVLPYARCKVIAGERDFVALQVGGRDRNRDWALNFNLNAWQAQAAFLGNRFFRSQRYNLWIDKNPWLAFIRHLRDEQSPGQADLRSRQAD